MHAHLAAFSGVGHVTFAARVDHGQAGAQPQVGDQFQVVANMQHGVRALVGEVTGALAKHIAIAGKLRSAAVGQVLGGTPTDGGLALAAEQCVAAEIVQRAADIGVGDLQAHGAFAQVHRVVVIDQAGFQARLVVEVEGGLVAHPGAAWLRAAVVACQIVGVGRARVVLDLVFGQAPRQFVFSFPVAQVEAGFQVGVEAVTDIGGNALGAAAAVRLVAVIFRIGQGHVIVEIAQHLARTDVPMLVAAAADLVAHLQCRRVVAGVGDIVDRAAQGQGALVKAIGATQHFGTAQPQRFEQFVRRAARAGQRQAVEHRVNAGTVRPRRTVEARAAYRQLDAVVACRLGEHPRLVGQHVLVAGHSALPHALHVHQVAGSRYFTQALAGCRQLVLLLIGDQHSAQFDRGCPQGGLSGSQGRQQTEAGREG